MKQQASAAIETRFKGKNIIGFTDKTLFVGIDVRALCAEKLLF
jgi:hypothetical protein